MRRVPNTGCTLSVKSCVGNQPMKWCRGSWPNWPRTPTNFARRSRRGDLHSQAVRRVPTLKNQLLAVGEKSDMALTREYALRALTDRTSDTKDGSGCPVCRRFERVPNPRVRAQALISLGTAWEISPMSPKRSCRSRFEPSGSDASHRRTALEPAGCRACLSAHLAVQSLTRR